MDNLPLTWLAICP